MAAPEQEKGTASVGLSGLAVVGENLALNIERNGFPIAVFTGQMYKVDDFAARAEGEQDDTHLSVRGATEIARLAVEGLKGANVPVAKHLRSR